ncbi:MAG: hypothetical protein IJU95_03185 [Treponema sp.]|nr:hypothetical protein [Treponema sp.]
MKRISPFFLMMMLACPYVSAFDTQANVADMFSDVRDKPIFIEETVYTLTDRNGKLIEESTGRKTVRFYDWQAGNFSAIAYNDAGNPYLYERSSYTSDGLVSSYMRKSKAGLISRRWEYSGDFSSYNVFTSVNGGEEYKSSTFTVEKEGDEWSSFEYSYDKSGKITKTKKTTGYPYTGDLRQDAKAGPAREGTVYYYFYEDDALSSITLEKNSSGKRVRSYYVNNKKIRTESFTLNKRADVEKEVTSGSSYIYKYLYDGNGNWLQKDSYYEDGADEIKYSRPLLRSKRSIQYNGSVTIIQEPDILYAFDSGDDDVIAKSTGAGQKETNGQLTEDDASKVPSEVFQDAPFTSVKVDPMDDRETLYIVFNAQEKVNDYVDNVSLIIRKKQGSKPEVYINWKEFLNHGRCLVTYRIDDSKARTEEWTLSTDEKASFFDGDVLQLLNKMKDADQFIARTTPFNEPPCTAIFDISSFKRLDEKYNWLFKKDW